VYDIVLIGWVFILEHR